MNMMFEKIKRKIAYKIRTLTDCVANSIIYFSYYHLSIKENMVYVESQCGEALNGNLLRICEELQNNEYGKLKIIVKAKEDRLQNIRTLVNNYGLNNVKIVTSTLLSLVFMEQAKYIFYDAGMQTKFVKREGQVFVNTWHGTPFKLMGKSVLAERHTLGNVQRNFLMSDYLLFPNKYMQEIFIKDYMLENLWKGSSLLAGYPRNTVFFDDDRRKYVKNKLKLVGKEVFAYLPTYRGTFSDRKNEQQLEIVEKYLDEIDNKLKDNQVLIVKFHLFNNKEIDYRKYNHIIGFPIEYETYDVLNIADCLITDYSSVFFDFANLRKKIILFSYDEEEYFADRGVYFPFSELPFSKVTSVDELIKELNTGINYDDSFFLQKYCTYDNINATKNLCRKIFKGENSCLEEKARFNGKENVLIYAGNLAKNGITSALMNCLSSIDTSKRNYILTFYRSSIKSFEQTLIIPDNIPYIVIPSDPAYTLMEKFTWKRLLQEDKKINVSQCIHRLFRREFKRQFWNVHFDHAIQFDGYTKNAMFLINEISANRIVYVHSDMLEEISTRHNASFAVLNYIYNSYDKVISVSGDIMKSILQIKNNKNNIFIANNFVSSNSIIQKANKNISIDRNTELICADPNGINGFLQSKGDKFINIGRFSLEKGQERLIASFEKYWYEHRDAKLIIIGGDGNLYRKIMLIREKSIAWRNIVIIKSLSNPMPILKQCNLFILSSFYEGLGLVVCEADALNIPCISTDIVGARSLFLKHKGFLVENNEEGILEGMYAFKRGEVKCLNIDFEKYKHQCLIEFETLFGENDEVKK